MKPARTRDVRWLLLLGLPLTVVAQDYSKVVVATKPLRGGIHLLTGAGGNVLVSTGGDGVFIVDDQFAPLSDKLRAAIRKLSDQPLRFVINTHWHGDHTGGNEALGRAGAAIVAHDNVRTRMSTDQFMAVFDRKVPASPPAALPVVTFAQGVTLHLNGDTVQVLHVPHAHTDGDALVHLRRANVLHMGDTWFNGSYPFIDTGSGGDIDGVLAAVDRGVSLSNVNTLIVPGHGPVGTRAQLQAYGAMLRGHRGRIAALKARGRTLQQVIAAKPTAATDAKLGGGFVKPEQLVTAIYESL